VGQVARETVEENGVTRKIAHNSKESVRCREMRIEKDGKRRNSDPGRRGMKEVGNETGGK
jgi:hypothetical protein